ncbi:MAG: hypothetical protein ACREB9_06195 [Thermoplasmata archaeon]
MSSPSPEEWNRLGDWRQQYVSQSDVELLAEIRARFPDFSEREAHAALGFIRGLRRGRA